MSEKFLLGMGIILLSGILNGIFVLPMKYSRRWRWENTWLTYTAFALLLFPLALAAIFVPKLHELYFSLPLSALWCPLAFGFLWGFAVVTYGLGFRILGFGLTIAIVAGLSCLSGPLVPLLVLHPEDLLRPQGILLLISIPILLLGLVFYGVAGRQREKEQALAKSGANSTAGNFNWGLVLVIFTGIFGANWSLGFAFSGAVVRRSMALGSNEVTSTYAVWALVLGAGFIANLVYCVFLLFRNKTWALWYQAGWAREAMIGIAMATLWFSGIAGYGIGTRFVGRLGTSMGYMAFAASTVLSSHFLSLITGEWQSTSRRTQLFRTGAVSAMIAAIVVLNLGGLF